MSRLRFVPVFLLAFVLMATGALRATAQDATPTAVDVSTADEDAVVAWGQWAFSFPTAVSPLADTSGAACGLGQQGDTFYLAPSAVGAGAITRACTILEGTSVVVPVIAVDCSTAEADPFHGDDADSLASCAKTNADAITDGYASVDDTDVADIASHRVQSPVFGVILPEGNVLNATAGATSMVVDGAFITVEGLDAGSHTISFGGTYESGGAIDITYNITVVAAPVASS
ncbi:MAG TPA: hypothetical protein VKB09_03135 [Thermomicrobiales bacterium]|nr:hypothetical protein [Thermomicrobiales bacterium]